MPQLGRKCRGRRGHRPCRGDTRGPAGATDTPRVAPLPVTQRTEGKGRAAPPNPFPEGGADPRPAALPPRASVPAARAPCAPARPSVRPSPARQHCGPGPGAPARRAAGREGEAGGPRVPARAQARHGRATARMDADRTRARSDSPRRLQGPRRRPERKGRARRGVSSGLRGPAPSAGPALHLGRPPQCLRTAPGRTREGCAQGGASGGRRREGRLCRACAGRTEARAAGSRVRSAR